MREGLSTGVSVAAVPYITSRGLEGSQHDRNSSFDPGGSFEEPPRSNHPLLRLTAQPRMSIYLDTDEAAALLIDAEVSYQLGQPLSESSITTPAQKLRVTVLTGDTTLGSASLDLGSVENEVPIALALLVPSLDAYNLTIHAELANSTVYSTSISFSYLPYPDDYGSVARLDNLYGGIYAQRGKNGSWEAIFPYTYYVQWTLYWDTDVSSLDEFASFGFNLVHIVPTGSLGDQPFPWAQFQPYLDRAADLGIWLQYDVIWEPDNTTEMIEQVTALRTHPSILSWYQSDEPDGKGNPINSTGLAYGKIKELDPYHPVSLALNCENFFYSEYAAGADIIVPDVYPISTNTSYSSVYGTVCNETYGCCGCDNCGIGPTVFDDIPHRLDEFRRRDELIGWAKTQWFAPQAFGNETFWTRYPTAPELSVMTLLAVNHGAKGLTIWDYPTTSELFNITRDMAPLFTSSTAASLFLGAPRYQDLTVTGSDALDAAAWVDEAHGQAVISVVSLSYHDIAAPVSITLPDGLVALGLGASLWGHGNWTVGLDGSVIESEGVGALATAVFLVGI